MIREIIGEGTPDMHSRFYVGRCVASGVVRVIDFENACELILTIRQMSMLANNATFFGLTNRGDMSIGTPCQQMRGNYIIMSMRNVQMHGCMDDDLNAAFERFVWLIRMSFGTK